jgi:hypothetical protein
MLWHTSALKRFSIEATDGTLGTVDDYLFDDKIWSLRWVVVDTGQSLPGKQVLLPISALGSTDLDKRLFHVKLTMLQVKNSPDVAAHPSVSRQAEAALFLHHGWNPYWGGDLYPMSNAIAVPYQAQPAPSSSLTNAGSGIELPREQDDPHLRSTVSVTGYGIHATDGEIGHVEDFLVNDARWDIPSIVVDTANWWSGRHVSISTKSIKRIDWDARLVHLNLSGRQIKDSPLDYSDSRAQGLFSETFLT